MATSISWSQYHKTSMKWTEMGHVWEQNYKSSRTEMILP